MAKEKEEEKVEIAPKKFDPAGNKPIFSWSSPEFVKYKKTSKWYLYLICIAIVLIGVFVWQKSWSAAVLVAVAAAVLTISSETKPRNVKCALYNEGVVAHGKVFSFNEFKHFWIAGIDLPKIYFQQTGRFSGPVSLPMLDQDVEQIKLFVSKHLPEVQGRSDINDSISTIFRI